MMNTILRALSVGILCTLYMPILSHAQQQDSTQREYLSNRTFGKYFISDHYAPIQKISLGFISNSRDYNINRSRTSDHILVNETSIGFNIPILTKRSRRKGTQFSLSVPVSASILFDFLEEETSPIINTDYRFGIIELNYNKEMNSEWVRNIGIKWIPLFHESTHIGDELTVVRAQDSLGITRINVTYEATDISVQINDPKDRVITNHSFKLGGRFLLNPNKGYYSVSELEADTNLVEDSKRFFEPYLQWQYQKRKGFFTSDRVMFIASASLNYRVRFGYPFYTEDADGNPIQNDNRERYKPSLNVLAGWRFKKTPDALSKLGAYARFYSGVNYHGQFRNGPTFQFFGFSIIYEN